MMPPSVWLRRTSRRAIERIVRTSAEALAA
jgi:hypothetical protein